MKKITDEEECRKFISYAKKPNNISIISNKHFKQMQEKNKGFKDYLDILNSYRSNHNSNLKLDGKSERKNIKSLNNEAITMSSIVSIKKLFKKKDNISISVDEKSLKNLHSTYRKDRVNSIKNPYSFGYKLNYKDKFTHNSIDMTKVKSVELRLLNESKDSSLFNQNEKQKNLNNLYFKTEPTDSQYIRQSYSNEFLSKSYSKNKKNQKLRKELLSGQELDNLISYLYNRQNGLINSNETFGELESKKSNFKNLIFLKEKVPNKYFQNLLVTLTREVDIKNSKNKLVSKEHIKNFINHEINKIYTNRQNETSSEDEYDEEDDDKVLPDIDQSRFRNKRGTYDLDYELKTQNLNELDGTEIEYDNWRLNSERRFVTNIDHKDNIFMFENRPRFKDDRPKNRKESILAERELLNQKSQKSKLVLQNKHQKTRNYNLNSIQQVLKDNSSNRNEEKSSTTNANTRDVNQTTEESILTNSKKKNYVRPTYNESNNRSFEVDKDPELIYNQEITNLKRNKVRNSILGLKFKLNFDGAENEELINKLDLNKEESTKKRKNKKIRDNQDSNSSFTGSAFDSMLSENSEFHDNVNDKTKFGLVSNKNLFSIRNTRRTSFMDNLKNDEFKKTLYKEKKNDSSKSVTKLSKFNSRKSLTKINDRINESNKKLNEIIEKHKSKFSGSQKNIQIISQRDYSTITTMTEESNFNTIFYTDSAGSYDSSSVEKNTLKNQKGNKYEFKKKLRKLYNFDSIPKVNFNKSAPNFQLVKNKKDGKFLFGIDLDFYNALKIFKNNERLIQLKKRRRKEKLMENNNNNNNLKPSMFKKNRNLKNKKIKFGSNDDYDLANSKLNKLKIHSDIIKIEEKLKMNKTLMFKSQKKLVEVVNSYEDDEKDTDEFKDNLKNIENKIKNDLKSKIRTSILKTSTVNKQIKFAIDKTEKDILNNANKILTKHEKNKETSMNKTTSIFSNKKNMLNAKSKGSQKQLINVFGPSSKNLLKDLHKESNKDSLRTKTFYNQKSKKKEDSSEEDDEQVEINDRERIKTRISTLVDKQMILNDDKIDMNLQKTLEKFKAAKIKNSNQNKAEELLKELLTFNMIRSQENVSLQEAKKDLVVNKEIDALINSNKIDTLPKHVDFELLIKNKIITKDQRDILMANFIHNNKNKDIVFEILELIRQQEEIKKKNWERRIKMHKDKALYEKNYSNKPRRPSELARDNELKKTIRLPKHIQQIEQLMIQDTKLEEELKKKREKAILFDIDVNINYLIAQMQTEEEMKRYNDLIEKMESLKKYDAESFVRNITSVYQDFKSEEKEIALVIRKEQNMNNYCHYLNSERLKHKELHEIFSSKYKFKDAQAKFTVGPLIPNPSEKQDLN